MVFVVAFVMMLALQRVLAWLMPQRQGAVPEPKAVTV
jgi:hypothetical protein